MKKLKPIKNIIILGIFLNLQVDTVHAATTTGQSIATIATPLVNLFNMLLAAGAFVFMIMLFYTAFKFAIAQGDPKGIMGAKDTFKYAMFGFVVTTGSFAIISIVARAFGVDESVITNPGQTSESAINELINFINRY